MSTIHILSRSGKGDSSPWRMTFSMEMSHHGFFEIFRIKIRAQAIEYIFLLKNYSLLYRYIHMVHEREKMYSLALIYFQDCKCRGYGFPLGPLAISSLAFLFENKNASFSLENTKNLESSRARECEYSLALALSRSRASCFLKPVNFRHV